MPASEINMLEPTDEAKCSPIRELDDYLEHRPPFLFVDQVEADDDLSAIRGTYRFAATEWFFAGHFPDDPMVPGVILLEVAAQTANVLLSLRAGCTTKTYLTNAGNVSFKAPVRPCETIVADVRLTRNPISEGRAEPGNFFSFKASIKREEVQCMRADLTIWWGR